MTDISKALATISAVRQRDPLAPVTVIAPSHAAALHLRRRLAEFGPFAAVRFETLPRVAELLGAGRLAAQGRVPLARPIGDYVASTVGAQSQGALEAVGDLPGYARTLRRIFSRLRRAGILHASDVPRDLSRGHMPEILRLYELFRKDTAGFYDPEDLQDAAAEAVETGTAGALADIGAVYVVPPGAETAAGVRLLAALRARSPQFEELSDTAASPTQRFVIAPDPASEAREVVRDVICVLEAGTAIDRIAIFYGADRAYGRLLREAFVAAAVPCVPLPGVPLIETRAGRGVLALGSLPDKDFSRTALIEFLSVAPIREWLPAGDDRVHEATTTWDKLSREAGITHGVEAWRSRVGAMLAEQSAGVAALEADPGASEGRLRAARYQYEETERLQRFIETLIARLEPLREDQPADRFIAAFRRIAEEYLRPDADVLSDVIQEIDQLGTVGAVGGGFSLSSFMTALRANLEAAHVRPTRLGDGVVIADYRTAPGLRFERVYLCGAYEGAFPAGPGPDAIIDDADWRHLKSAFPYIEDAATRISRSRAASTRAVASAGDGALTWSAPAYEPGGTREYYPSPVMAQAFSSTVGERVTASELRRRDGVPGLLTRARSPLAVSLRGAVLDRGELAVRRAVTIRRHDTEIASDHPAMRAVSMLRSRRGQRFTEWDGNLSALPQQDWLQLHKTVSPTSLESYGACGYKYFARSVLRLNSVEEPDDRDMMEAATRGSLIHDVLETFFREEHARGRPGVNEEWTQADRSRLMEVLAEALDNARSRGLTGLPIYAEHEARAIRADLARFLVEDTAFRRLTGAVPSQFECSIPETQIAGVTLRGRVDRIDRTPDGKRAWVIDYKTGSIGDCKNIAKDPLDGGRKLQLPTYLAAAGDAEHVQALYWFITHREDYEQIVYDPDADRDDRFHSTVAAIVGGIGAGAFPAVSGEEDDWKEGFDNCKWCDFDRICSRRRDSEFPAKSADSPMAPWHAVRAAASPEGMS